MGGAIAKLAFQPPPPQRALEYLPKESNHILVPNSQGNNVSLLHFVSAAGPLRPVRNGTRYLMIFSHGNAEDLLDCYPYLAELRDKLHIDVLGYDYSGYGCSPGKCSEASAFSCANAAFEYAINNLQVPHGNIILCGRSLGSGPAVHLANKHRGLSGLILLSPLCSAAAVAGTTAKVAAYPFDIFTNLRKIASVTDYPVLIVHGTADKVINISHGEKLLKEVKKKNPRARGCWVEGAGHNDIEIIMGRKFFQVLQNFVNTLSHSPMSVQPLDNLTPVENQSKCCMLGW